MKPDAKAPASVLLALLLLRRGCVDVIAAIYAGERFVVAEDIDGRINVLKPGLCGQCPLVTLVVEPPTALPVRCA